jgi:CDP-glucose 4,6-dehydratase
MGDEGGRVANGGPDAGFWRDRRVLVTGGTGLLGGWLVRRLVDLGADVVCLVRDWVPQSELVRARLIDRVAVVRGDVRDQALIERAVGEYEVETVLHLAAQTIVGIANRDPISTFETNIQGTWALLEACRRTGVAKQIVLASSDKAYGDQDQLPYDEDMPLRGRHPYDVSKSCADLIGRAYWETYRLPVAITRCGNLYGGGDLNFNRIVPGTIRSALRGEPPIIRSDGTLTRDYIYVEDAALAYLRCAEAIDRDPAVGGLAFNFSYERPLTVLDITELTLRAAGRPDLRPVVLNQASHEIPHQYLKSELARRVLGWHPAFDLKAGLERTVGWYRDYFGTPAGPDATPAGPNPIARAPAIPPTGEQA